MKFILLAFEFLFLIVFSFVMQFLNFLQPVFGWWFQKTIRIALVGPDNAGKTALLHVLHDQRISGSYVVGDAVLETKETRLVLTEMNQSNRFGRTKYKIGDLEMFDAILFILDSCDQDYR